MNTIKRREFLKFLGVTGGSIYLTTHLSGCLFTSKSKNSPEWAISPSDADQVILSKDLNYKQFLAWNDKINDTEYFGTNNDYIAFIKDSNNEAYLWVNHEHADPHKLSDYQLHEKGRTKEQVDKEQLAVGGSILKISQQNGQWKLIENHPSNLRVTAKTKIPFAKNIKIQGKDHAIGTFANCAGGVTPWNTILTCEENYHHGYGEVEFNSKGERKLKTKKKSLNWHLFYDHPPEHYGWVVEVEPKTGKAKKHTSMGRFAHESATTVRENNKVVVYSGDDKENECLYKFISDSPDSLESGTLYAADLKLGRWLPLDIEQNTHLKKKFKTQLDLLIRTREAAHFVGATELDRPEDIEIHPKTKEVFVALTNNKTKANAHGSILKIKEKNNDHTSLEFEYESFLTGGEDTGFSCPDNLAFDKVGNLWFTTDISTKLLNNYPYSSFKNNGLFVVPIKGKYAGLPIQVASAPVGAEFTGPCFSDDYETLFLSVQHPGEGAEKVSELKSHWPDGGNSIPRSAVLTIQGPLLKKLMS